MPCTKSLTIDKTSPVLVTGASGYVAGVLIQQLLQQGLTVHGTVRDATKKDSHYKYLQDAADACSGKLLLFSADLLEDGSFADAMKGCTVVFHTASPFNISPKDPQKDLVDPAVLGTKNVLNQASKTPCVKRIVLTSSVAAVFSDPADLADMPDKDAFSEEDWNTVSSLEHQPYYYSKTMAEKKAWEMYKAQEQWKLVVVNPTFVMGPGLKYHKTSESFDFMLRLGGGEFSGQGGAPDLNFGFVDVRDVAAGHMAAAFIPEAEGRHLLVGRVASCTEFGLSFADVFPGYPIARHKNLIPKFLFWAIAPYFGITRRFVTRNFGHPVKIDNSKSKSALGIEYIPLEETTRDMFQQLIDNGAVVKKDNV